MSSQSNIIRNLLKAICFMAFIMLGANTVFSNDRINTGGQGASIRAQRITRFGEAKRLAYLLQASFPDETSELIMRSKMSDFRLSIRASRRIEVLILWVSATPSVADSHTEMGRKRMEREC